MRITALLILLLFLCSSNLRAADKLRPALKDRPDKINYSYGYQLGRDIVADGLEFKPESLWRALNKGLASPGIEDASCRQDASDCLGYALGREFARRQLRFRGPVLWQAVYDSIYHAEPLMAAVEMTRVLAQIGGSESRSLGETVVKTVTVSSTQRKHYRSRGEKVLAENGSRKEIIRLPSGLQYRIITSGAGKTPRETDTVLVNYQGRSVDGQVFSRSAAMGIPQSQEVVVNKTIPGWAEALQLMREGDRWELYLPRFLAYKRGGPMRGKAVVFDLELLEVLPEFR